MIVSLWVGQRGAPSKVGFDHVGDDGTRLGEVEGGDGRIHLVLLRHKPLRPYVSCAWSAAAWAAWQASDDSGDEPSAHGRD